VLQKYKSLINFFPPSPPPAFSVVVNRLLGDSIWGIPPNITERRRHSDIGGKRSFRFTIRFSISGILAAVFCLRTTQQQLPAMSMAMEIMAMGAAQVQVQVQIVPKE